MPECCRVCAWLALRESAWVCVRLARVVSDDWSEPITPPEDCPERRS